MRNCHLDFVLLSSTDPEPILAQRPKSAPKRRGKKAKVVNIDLGGDTYPSENLPLFFTKQELSPKCEGRFPFKCACVKVNVECVTVAMSDQKASDVRCWER